MNDSWKERNKDFWHLAIPLMIFAILVIVVAFALSPLYGKAEACGGHPCEWTKTPTRAHYTKTPTSGPSTDTPAPPTSTSTQVATETPTALEPTFTATSEQPTTTPTVTEKPRREKTPIPTATFRPFTYPTPTPTKETLVCQLCKALEDGWYLMDWMVYPEWEYIVQHVEDHTCVVFKTASGEYLSMGCFPTCGGTAPSICRP